MRLGWRGSSASRILPRNLEALECLAEFFQFGYFGDETAQRLNGSGNMIEKRLVTFHQAEKSVGPERLHEALDAAKPEDFAKIRRHRIARCASVRFVIGEQLFALRG